MSIPADAQRRGLLAGFAAASIWGGMYVVSKVVLDVIPPFALLSLRLILGAAALGLWLAFKRLLPKLFPGQWFTLLLLGVLGYGISLGLQLTGTRLSTAANGAVITAATPAFVYLFAGPVLAEAVTRRRWWALLVSTLGVLLVVDPRQAQWETGLWQGNLLLIGAAITWALYSVWVRRTTRQVAALPFTFIALLGGLLLALPAAAIEWNEIAFARIDAGILLGVLYLGVVSTALAAYWWNRSFELLEAGVASLTFFAQPLVGAVLGVAILNEELSLSFLLGGLLILLGLWLAARDDTIAYRVRNRV